MTSITIKLDRALREELREAQNHAFGGEVSRALRGAFPEYFNRYNKLSLALDLSTVTFSRD